MTMKNKAKQKKAKAKSARPARGKAQKKTPKKNAFNGD
jgi:hypothetical protein